MRKTQLFVEGRHEIGEVVHLLPADAHKLMTVLRAKSGDEIEIVDSAAQRFHARIAIQGPEVFVTLLASDKQVSTEFSYRVDLAQALPKAQKMDVIVEKSTELGVFGIRPFVSERCIVRDAPLARIERWNRIARSAAEQAGRQHRPHVNQCVSWEQLIEIFSEYDDILFAWELAVDHVRNILGARPGSGGSLLIVIGPEGGFAQSEADEAALAGAAVVGLGYRILRTETAALYLLSVLGYLDDR